VPELLSSEYGNSQTTVTQLVGMYYISGVTRDTYQRQQWYPYTSEALEKTVDQPANLYLTIFNFTYSTAVSSFSFN